MIILNGIKLGFVLAFLVGPVFFAIIQTSVERGFWNGVLVALGVSLSDILYVTICYFGLAQFIDQEQNKIYMAYGGGAILILFGLYHLLIKSRKSRRENVKLEGEKGKFRYFLKGFIINGISPMVILFWLGAISIASVDFGYSKGSQFAIFFITVLITVFGTDILKAYLANKLRRLVTPRTLMFLNIIVGIILIVFGGRLLLMAKGFTVIPG
ncbi:MAG TPA: LysE family transporter [Cyclobacteriaceae bacterium]